MVYMKLIVALGCLAATTLARPALPPSETELAARQCVGCMTNAAPAPLRTGLPLPQAPPSNAHLAARQCIEPVDYPSDAVRPACTSVDMPGSHSSTHSATDYGNFPELGTAEGASSTQDTSNISDCALSGFCNEVVGRGLSDHLNPTIPDEDEGEE